MRLVGVVLSAAMLCGACAQQQEPSSDCVLADCRATCAPLSGTCLGGGCRCVSLDGGGDDASCVSADCSASCRGRGYPDGACLGTTCQCVGTPSDAGAEDAAVADDGTGDRADDGAADDGGAEDVAPREAGAPCSVDDLVEQRLCDDGLKCAFSALAGLGPDARCSRDGARGLDQSCGSSGDSDTCAAGMMCLSDGSSLRCRGLCRNDADCATLGGRSGCLLQINIGGTVATGIAACTFDCDVLAATGCDTTQACRPEFIDTGGGAYIARSDCTGVGAGTQGADCSTGGAAACAAHYQCFNLAAGTTQCLYVCELSRYGADCPAGTCNPINDPANRLGACL